VEGLEDLLQYGPRKAVSGPRYSSSHFAFVSLAGSSFSSFDFYFLHEIDIILLFSMAVEDGMDRGHDAQSIRSSCSSLCLGEDDRRYLEALKDRDYVVTKNTRQPLGLFSVVAFILQQVIGELSYPHFISNLVNISKAREFSGHH
jgi:hypothetical protein